MLATKTRDLFEDTDLRLKIAQGLAQTAGLSKELSSKIKMTILGDALGRATTIYQGFISPEQKKYSTEEDYTKNIKSTKKKSVILPMHQEIGWAFLTTKFGINSFNRPIFNCIYWSDSKSDDQAYDGKSKKRCTRKDILDKLGKTDYKFLENFYRHYTWDGFKTFEPSPNELEVPDIFCIEGAPGVLLRENPEIYLIRSIVLATDKYMNDLGDLKFKALLQNQIGIDEIITEIEGKIRPINICGLKTPTGYDPIRFSQQLEIANIAAKNKTTIVKAPAGYGKTIIGIISGLSAGKRLIWVCPRNAVANSVFDCVKNELLELNLSYTVQLFFGGEVQEPAGADPFQADILITNSDSIFNPILQDRVSNRLIYGTNSILVVDEFHEFVNKKPIFSIFIILMRARHQMCGKNIITILFSATPIPIHSLWESDKKTVVLPNDTQHYPTVHNKIFSVEIASSLPQHIKQKSLVFCASIKNCQRHHELLGGSCNKIVHSRYPQSRKRKLLEDIYKSLNKRAKKICKDKITSALIIGASFDISFENIYVYLISPQHTLQPLGRLDRWGFEKSKCLLYLVNSKLSAHDEAIEADTIDEDDADDGDDNDILISEKAAVMSVYNLKFRTIWIEHLLANLKDNMTLTDFYNIYNEFYTIHKEKFIIFYRDYYEAGLLSLIKMHPKYHEGSRQKRLGPSLRTPSGSVFLTIQKEGTEDWLGPNDVFAIERPRFRTKPEDIQQISSKGGAISKALKLAGFSNIKYLQDNPPQNQEQWGWKASHPDTPYPDITKIYSEILGVVDKNLSQMNWRSKNGRYRK
jgi:hypothetical protein